MHAYLGYSQRKYFEAVLFDVHRQAERRTDELRDLVDRLRLENVDLAARCKDLDREKRQFEKRSHVLQQKCDAHYTELEFLKEVLSSILFINCLSTTKCVWLTDFPGKCLIACQPTQSGNS